MSLLRVFSNVRSPVRSSAFKLPLLAACRVCETKLTINYCNLRVPSITLGRDSSHSSGIGSQATNSPTGTYTPSQGSRLTLSVSIFCSVPLIPTMHCNVRCARCTLKKNLRPMPVPMMLKPFLFTRGDLNSPRFSTVLAISRFSHIKCSFSCLKGNGR